MEPINRRFEDLADPYRTAYLIGNFISGSLTIEERDELDAWVIADERNMQLFEDMTDERFVESFLDWWSRRDTEQKLVAIKKKMRFRSRVRVMSLWKYAAAACFIALTGWGIYVILLKKERALPAPPIVLQDDIPPGDTIARLRLSDGRWIALNAALDTVTDQLTIAGGLLAYNARVADTGTHFVSVPRKGFFRLLLPDGTRVFLNAESSIRYPASFAGAERRVEVTGETYFEVAHDAAHPFIVTVGGARVRALGTAFNIRDYDQARVTLVEGKVSVSGDGRQEILQPGDQLALTRGGWSRTRVEDMEDVTAWVSGSFKFNGNTVAEIAAELGRWYDATFIFKDDIPYHFIATFSRSQPISEVLRLLSRTNQVHFDIQGNTITVTR